MMAIKEEFKHGGRGGDSSKGGGDGKGGDGDKGGCL
jgi:hypothetical protein